MAYEPSANVKTVQIDKERVKKLAEIYFKKKGGSERNNALTELAKIATLKKGSPVTSVYEVLMILDLKDPVNYVKGSTSDPSHKGFTYDGYGFKPIK